MNQQLKDIVTGKEIQQGDFNFDWQEFALRRIEEGGTDDIELQFINYNRGFIDGLKLALTLGK